MSLRFFLIFVMVMLFGTIFHSPVFAYDFSYGGVAVKHLNCTETDYVATEDSNLARGSALMEAVTSISSGDSLYLTKGTFDVGSNIIDLSQGGTIPGYVNMHGAGKTQSIITSDHYGEFDPQIFQPTTNSVITDLTIRASAVGVSDYSFPFGAQNDVSNVYVKNVNIVGYSDGIYLTSNGSYTFVNVSVNTTWDAITVIGYNKNITNTINLYDCSINANGGHLLSTRSRAINFYSNVNFIMEMNVWNSNLVASGFSNPTSVYEASDVDGEASIHVNMYGGSIRAYGRNANSVNDLTGNGVFNFDSNVDYNAGVVGTITTVDTVEEVVPPTPNEICSNPFTVTAIGDITGDPIVGSVFTANSLTPSTATVTYQWSESDSADGTYTNINGATSNTYTVVVGDVGKYMKVSVGGSGNYSGSATSNPTALIVGVCSNVVHAITYNSYPLCGPATCDSGYVVSGGSCIIQSVSSGSTGGGNAFLYQIQQAENSKALMIDSLKLQIQNLQTLIQQISPQLLTKDLKYGSSDSEVILLQNILKKLNLLSQSVPTVKHFGVSTLKAVKEFQIKYNILTSKSSQYGIVGPRTREKLNELNK